MARDASTIGAEIEALLKAKATGAEFVSIGGKQVRYRTVEEFDKILAGLRTELGTINGASLVRRVRVRPARDT